MFIRNLSRIRVSSHFIHTSPMAMICLLLALAHTTTAQPQRLDMASAPGVPTMVARSAPASPASAITIDQAVDEAIQNNLDLLAQRVNLTVAEATFITAKLRPNPVFSFSADTLDLLGTGFDTNNNGGPPEYAWRVDVPIERGGKRRWRMELAEHEKDIAEAQLMDAIRKLKLDVSLAGIDVIQAKANVALARDNLRTAEELVRINDARVKAGSLAPLELTRSQVAMLQFRNQVARADLELVKAKTKLQSLLGRTTIADDFDILDELKAPPFNSALALERLQESALADRPDILALERVQARAQSDLQLQVAQGKVDYTWGVEYRRQQGVNGKSNSLGLFLSVPLPFFSRNQGEIARAKAEQEQTSRQIEALKAQARAEVTTAYQEFLSARQLVTTIERDLLQPAEKARDTVGYVYRTGASSLIEFLDAQRAFNDTMQSYYEAQAAYRHAILQLNAAVGKEVVH